jgi:hypothetical protein
MDRRDDGVRFAVKKWLLQPAGACVGATQMAAANSRLDAQLAHPGYNCRYQSTEYLRAS